MASNETDEGINGKRMQIFDKKNRYISETVEDRHRVTIIDFWYPLDCLHGSWDRTGLIMLIGLFFVRFSFKFFCLFRAID